MTLASVPVGKVSTYGNIATRAGFPGLARYVASILKNLPHDSTIPWHRIINSKGQSSFPYKGDMFYQQVNRLKSEGVSFSPSYTVSKAFFW